VSKLNVFDVLLIFAVYLIGTLLSLIVTGLLVNKLVIKKVMQNKDVQDLLTLFRESKDTLKKILQNQKTH
jgi:hypothetical protein